MNNDLLAKIQTILNPLVEEKILTIVKDQSGRWIDVGLIEGTFDYLRTQRMMFDCFSICRNEIRRLSKKNYLKLWSNSELKSLDDSIYFLDKLMQAFLQAQAINQKATLNDKLLWQANSAFLNSNHTVIINANNALQQRINEGHVKTTIILALVTLVTSLLISIVTNFC